MQLQLISFTLLVALCSFLGLSSFVAADCCVPRSHFPYGSCRYGGYGTPCCGVGSCNIFCCNCDGGCRGASRSKKDNLAEMFSHMEARDDDASECTAKFNAADNDSDGLLTYQEWANSPDAAGMDSGAQEAHWQKFDTEGKGYLTQDETYARRA